MSVSDHISSRFPALGRQLGRISLADLPTPVEMITIEQADGRRELAIKMDHLTSADYGGNKIRKLEYALYPAVARDRVRVATFGTVGSHHALATSLYARKIGLDCTCFLSHQPAHPSVAATLNAHLTLGSEIVRYGGSYADRIGTIRSNLWRRNAWVIPLGGSSWRGTLGFVAAGLELAWQIDQRLLPAPQRIYIAAGTMGSAAGLAIGLALAESRCRIEAIRVSATSFCNDKLLRHLIDKTIAMMRRLDESVPADLAGGLNLRLRDEFFGAGYGRSDAATDRAVRFAQEQLGLNLEQTYTGKAMAALLHDLPAAGSEQLMFWNTCNSAPLPQPTAVAAGIESLPEEFTKYLT